MPITDKALRIESLQPHMAAGFIRVHSKAWHLAKLRAQVAAALGQSAEAASGAVRRALESAATRAIHQMLGADGTAMVRVRPQMAGGQAMRHHAVGAGTGGCPYGMPCRPAAGRLRDEAEASARDGAGVVCGAGAAAPRDADGGAARGRDAR